MKVFEAMRAFHWQIVALKKFLDCADRAKVLAAGDPLAGRNGSRSDAEMQASSEEVSKANHDHLMDYIGRMGVMLVSEVMERFDLKEGIWMMMLPAVLRRKSIDLTLQFLRAGIHGAARREHLALLSGHWVATHADGC